MPDDELPSAGEIGNLRWRITDFLGRERAPDFLPVVLVECNDRTVRAADHADETLAVEQRMSGPTPGGRIGEFVIVQKVMFPNDLAVGGIQAKEVTHRAQREDATTADDRRRSRPG